MFISVLICTRDRAERLGQVLSSLLRHGNLESQDWEVLVVESSTDRTGEVCEEFRLKFPRHFRFVREERLGKSIALNTAIAAARGDVLAFIDDDVICASDYVEGIRSVFDTQTADAVQGRVLLECEGGWPDWLGGTYALMADVRDYGPEVIDLDGTLCGTNMIVRANVFKKVGGFATELGPGSAVGMWEDTEISLRIRKAGFRTIYAPQILVYHPWSQTRLTRSFIRKRYFDEGRAQAYYADLPTPLFRFGLYVVKEILRQEAAAIWHLCAGHPAAALGCQCEARSQAGLFWQHWLFKRGVPRRLSESLTSCNEATKRESPVAI